MHRKLERYYRLGAVELMDLRMPLAPDPFASRQSLEKLAYRIPEAVAATGISRTGIYELIKAGRLRVRSSSEWCANFRRGRSRPSHYGLRVPSGGSLICPTRDIFALGAEIGRPLCHQQSAPLQRC